MSIKNYSKTNPCPICGRYKSAYQNKCQGFVTDDGRYAYCSREISEGQKTITTPWGKTLWRHFIGGTTPPIATNKPITPKSLPAIRQASTRPPREDISYDGPTDREVDLLDEVIRKFTEEGKWPY